LSAARTTCTCPLSLHDALPIWRGASARCRERCARHEPRGLVPPACQTTAAATCEPERDRTWRRVPGRCAAARVAARAMAMTEEIDRKSTRLNSSHVKISYAVFC